MPVAIRGASIADAPGILDCLRLAFEPHRQRYTPAGYANTVFGPLSCIWITRISSNFIGKSILIDAPLGVTLLPSLEIARETVADRPQVRSISHSKRHLLMLLQRPHEMMQDGVDDRRHKPVENLSLLVREGVRKGQGRIGAVPSPPPSSSYGPQRPILPTKTRRGALHPAAQGQHKVVI